MPGVRPTDPDTLKRLFSLNCACSAVLLTVTGSEYRYMKGVFVSYGEKGVRGYFDSAPIRFIDDFDLFYVIPTDMFNTLVRNSFYSCNMF